MKIWNQVRPYGRACLRPLLAVPVVCFFTGCATGGLTNDPFSGSGRQDVTALITNYNWSDVKIYLLVDGTRLRLGTVGGMQSRTVKIPPVFVVPGADLRLQAQPLASRETVTTYGIVAVPGDEIVWTLEAYLAQSINTVWIR